MYAINPLALPARHQSDYREGYRAIRDDALAHVIRSCPAQSDSFNRHAAAADAIVRFGDGFALVFQDKIEIFCAGDVPLVAPIPETLGKVGSAVARAQQAAEFLSHGPPASGSDVRRYLRGIRVIAGRPTVPDDIDELGEIVESVDGVWVFLLFLAARHRDACVAAFFGEEFLRFAPDPIASDALVDRFHRCMADASARFVVLPFAIDDPDDPAGSHVNVILVDKLRMRAMRFEPHGGRYQSPKHAIDAAARELLGPYGVDYLPAESACPMFGLQSVEKWSPSATAGRTGLCTIWALVLLPDAMMTFPETDPVGLNRMLLSAMVAGLETSVRHDLAWDLYVYFATVLKELLVASDLVELARGVNDSLVRKRSPGTVFRAAS